MSRFVIPAKQKLNSKNLSFVILAAGACKKFKTKSLFQIAGKTLIEYQIAEIRAAFGNEIDVIVVLGFEFIKIYEKIPQKVRVIYNENYLENSNAFSLLLALYTCITDNCYILNGDILFDRNLFKLSIPETHTFGWPTIKDSGSKVGITYMENVEHFQYGLPNKWNQIILLNKKDIDNYKIIFSKHKESKPQLFEILNELIDNFGTKIKYIPAQLKEISSGRDLL